jgi:hypothetical protein
MGCFMALFALASLFIGLALGQLPGVDRRVTVLICALGGLPLNLFIAVRITRLLISRIVRPETTSEASAPADEDEQRSSGGLSA